MAYRKRIKVERDDALTQEMLADIETMSTNIQAFNRLLTEYGVDKIDSTMGEVAEDYMTLKKDYNEMVRIEEDTRIMERIFELPYVNENVVEDFSNIISKWHRKLAEQNGEY